MLQIAAEQNNKGVALSKHLRLSHRTRTARVINTILLHLENSFIVAVRVQI
jgi:hypothetical protein